MCKEGDVIIKVHLDFSIELNGRKIFSRESWRRLRKIVKARDEAICHYCGAYTPDGHVDHILALSRGGSDDLSNLVWSCPTCNIKKGNDVVLSGGENPSTSADRAIAELYEFVATLWAAGEVSRAAARKHGFTRSTWEKYIGGRRNSDAPGILANFGAVTMTQGGWQISKSLEEILNANNDLHAYAEKLKAQN
jgi:hypothetical protein